MEKELEKKLIKKILLSPVMLIVIFSIITVVLSLGTSYAANVYLYDSKDVSYDNTRSGIIATDVQGAVDELYSAANDYSSINTRLTAVEDYKNQIYPVGSIYIGVNNTNPSTLFGGTWESFGEGRTLVGFDSSDADFDTAEETNGSKTVKYTPAGSVGDTTLTINQIPSHNHAATSDGTWIINDSTRGTNLFASGSISAIYASKGSSKTTGNRGGGQAHNHSFTGTEADINIVQPYITVYMWKRTG